jgi:acyl-CoA thioester hydrolase
MRASNPHRLTIRVYYEDTDFSGVVYHASYLRFLERGRTETLRDLDIHQADLHGAGGEGALSFVVRRMAIEWMKPARMDDLLVVETNIQEIRGASMALKQQILLNETVLLTADVLVALVSGGKPARMPVDLKQRLLTED